MDVFNRFKRLIRDSLPGLGSACLMLLLLKLGVVVALEQVAYSSLFRARGPHGWDERIVTVEIDDKSLAALGHFPLPRQYYAQLLETLSVSDPGVIAFDLLFIESSGDDPALAAALAEQGRVVLAQAWDAEGQSLLPQQVLAENAIATGHIHKIIESDGSTRQMYLNLDRVPSLALASLQAYSLQHNSEDGTGLKFLQSPQFTQSPQSTDPVWVNWPGPSQEAVRYSFIDVIQGRVPLEAFTDKIVMVGVTATGLDTLTTPYDNASPSAGVFLQVSLIDNLLNQTFLTPVNSVIWVPLLLLGGPGLSLLLSHRRVGIQLLIWAIAGLSWGSVGLLTFSMTYWLPMVGPIVFISLTSCTLLLTERLRLDKQLRQAMQNIRDVHDANPLSAKLFSDTFLHHRRPKPIPIHPLLQDVSDLASFTHQLSTQAWTDTLTQIANRHAFDQYLSQAWFQATQGQLPISLILCDVDHFKRYNDTYGHLAGDDCLRRVAQALAQTAHRPVDLVARYGGEEFAILLPNTDCRGAHWVASQACEMIRTLQVRDDLSSEGAQVTISAGVATLEPSEHGTTSPTHLIQVADRVLYEAKAAGRNRVVVAETPISPKAHISSF